MDWTEEQRQLNSDLVEQIRARNKQTLHGYGITTADRYVKGVLDCLPDGHPSRLMSDVLLKDAQATLVYGNEDMTYDPPLTTSATIDEYCKSIRVDTPPRTLMVFEHVITTPRQDRDGDILRTEGAIVDPSMPLLWHHMLPMPIGKMLKVLQHNSKRLKVSSAIIDSPLGNDVAALIEFGALRISHGFRPLKFRPLERKQEPRTDDITMPPGFEIKEFEIMEASTVTVPSNVEAVITVFSRGKLHDPVTKTWAKLIAAKRPPMVPGYRPEYEICPSSYESLDHFYHATEEMEFRAA